MRRKGRDATLILPGYRDLEEIGGGAFATVFRATETETGRPVALKILKLDTVHEHLLETFQREIQALAAVSGHPNIVTLYRPFSTADGRPVLVLELCRESLAQRLRDTGPLPAPEVTRVGVKIAGALETAHRNGFLHRDMKPQNLLVTFFGEPALADFGVAALQASAQSTAGVFGFTTLHAAPEMLEGHHLSPATDVYGLASTMYQLLSGQAPFTSFENEAPASVILRILRDPVPPLPGESVPLHLADLLEAALSKEPERRPRTAADFGRALQDVEANQGWSATSFSAWGEDGSRAYPSDPVRAEAEPDPVERGPMGVRPGPTGPGGVRPESRLPPLLPPSSLSSAAPPSITPPAQGVRNVVEPGQDGRRSGPGVPLPEPNGGTPVAHPLDSPLETSAASNRPVFVDPEPASDYRTGPSFVTEGKATQPWPPEGQVRSAPPVGTLLPGWALGALGLAALVVVAAVLLLLGVI